MCLRRAPVVRIGIVAVACLVAPALAAPLLAQQPPPKIGPFAVDLRGALARFEQSGFTAGELGVPAASLPKLGLGLEVGAHWYPVRLRKVTLGLGASVLWSRGRKTPTDTNGQVTGPTVDTRLIALAPQVSLNFGTGSGWSYLSGGIGRSTYDTRLASTPADNSRRVRTINYGGGARWFAEPHVAFSLDLRFYSLAPQEATPTLPPTARTTRMVFTVGISIK